MPKKTTDQPIDQMWIVTGNATTPITRGGRGGEDDNWHPLKVEQLAVNVNVFVQQMGKVLESTPPELGKFHFDEFEIHADVSADGSVGILGTGVHAGASGGLKFVFRRSSASSE